MRTLHFGLHVADLDRSLAFYSALGYLVVGEVPETPLGHLSMLKLPTDEFVTIELVYRPARENREARGGLSHFVIQVDSTAPLKPGVAYRVMAVDIRGMLGPPRSTERSATLARADTTRAPARPPKSP